MASRLDLHNLLVNLLGTNNVYFNPPSNIRLNYPCIKYRMSGIDKKNANNSMYIKNVKYEIFIIGPNTDIVLDKLIELPMCTFVRSYIADSLNHTILQLYY